MCNAAHLKTHLIERRKPKFLEDAKPHAETRCRFVENNDRIGARSGFVEEARTRRETSTDEKTNRAKKSLRKEGLTTFPLQGKPIPM